MFELHSATIKILPEEVTQFKGLVKEIYKMNLSDDEAEEHYRKLLMLTEIVCDQFGENPLPSSKQSMQNAQSGSQLSLF